MAAIDRDRWLVLEPLLDHVLELSFAERDSWLGDLRARSPQLADELASLLAGEQAADGRGFLTAPPELPLPLSLEGVALGAYTLVRPLGQGGMGTVWLARRTDGRFEGLAAVKLLNPALLSHAGQARFRREGSVLARLVHPGIARLLDAGVTTSGQPYLVLEHVDGQRIDAFVAERRLPLDERIRLVLDVLGAVGHAHANLIVHRDLKPSNILVMRDGTVKLLDFGIAKLLDADASAERSALTLDGAGALTPEYAAPEQVRGDAITTATDVYALGVLLYVLLAGRHPTAHGCRTPAEMVRALLDDEPPSLGLGDLDTILGKSLRKEPRERYQTVQAFADDLRRYLRHEPVSARRHSLAYRARKFVRRNRAAVAASSAALAALLAATAFSIVQMRAAARERDTALVASRRANAQVDFQSLLMSELGDRPITMREILDRGRAMLEREYGGDRPFLASLLVQLSSRYAELGEDTIRASLLARAESIAVAARDTAELVEVRCQLADVLRTRGRYDDARVALRRAVGLLRTARSPEDEAICLDNVAQLENETDHPERAAPAIRRAIAIRDSLGERSDAFYAGLRSTLAYVLDNEGHHRAAIAEFRRAGAMMDSSGRGDMIARAVIEHDMALTLLALGETAEAERLLHDALERVSRGDPTGHLPSQPVIHYAHAALFDGHADSAAKYFALLAAQAAREHDAYWEGRGLFGLALAQVQLGRLADARRSTARFRAIAATTSLRSTDDQVTDVRILEAWLAVADGDSATAHRKAVAVLRANGYFDGKRKQVFRPALILAARTAQAGGDGTGALRFARDARAIATLDSLTETRSAYVGEAWLVEGRALLASGDSASARSALARALVALRSGVGAGDARAREAEAMLRALGG